MMGQVRLGRTPGTARQYSRGDADLVDRNHPPVESDGLAAERRFGTRLGETEPAGLAASQAISGDVEEREARGRELRAAQDLARQSRRQTIVASAVAVIILALGGTATWVFR